MTLFESPIYQPCSLRAASIILLTTSPLWHILPLVPPQTAARSSTGLGGGLEPGQGEEDSNTEDTAVSKHSRPQGELVRQNTDRCDCKKKEVCRG